PGVPTVRWERSQARSIAATFGTRYQTQALWSSSRLAYFLGIAPSTTERLLATTAGARSERRQVLGASMSHSIRSGHSLHTTRPSTVTRTSRERSEKDLGRGLGLSVGLWRD